MLERNVHCFTIMEAPVFEKGDDEIRLGNTDALVMAIANYPLTQVSRVYHGTEANNFD